METRVKVIIITVSLATAFAVGRYTVPTKTVVQTKIVEVEKKDTKTHDNIVVTETDKPDGTKVIVTKTVDDTDTTTNLNVSDITTKTVEKTTGRMNLSILGGAPLTFSGPTSLVYGAHVSKDIIGPVSIGVWYLSSSTGGLSVGLTF